MSKPVSLVETRCLFAPFAKEKSIVIAISGGPDSTALLWLAARWRAARKQGPSIVAVTVDHGLRADSVREANAVKQFARTLDVAHRTVRWIGDKPKTGLQEAARNVRYALLAVEAKRAGARHVLTAHTLDDQAETVLIRLTRGSGPAGLQAMAALSPYPGQPALVLARPLLAVFKARLVATLVKARLSYADDPSNRDPRHTRARLRALMPTLAAEGLTAQRLALLASRVQRAETALRAAATHALDDVSLTPWGEGTRIAFDCARFWRLPREIALRLLGQAVAHVGNEGPVELGKLETLFEAVEGAGGHAPYRRTLAGAQVTLLAEELVVERAPPRRTADGRGRRISALTTREGAGPGKAS